MNWQPVTIALAALTPWERNPKRISRSHAKRLLDLWDKLGQFQTIAIGPGGEVYDGHQRLSVLLAAYGKDYQVQALQAPRALTEEERQELTIAAHVGTVGQFDWDALAGWDAGALQGWGLDGETLGNWRADVGALDAMLAAEKEAPEDVGPQIDRAEELRQKWGVEPGQLWQLGEHRLICGDCTDASVVARVMGGDDQIDLLATDPPFAITGSATGTEDMSGINIIQPFFRLWLANLCERLPLFGHAYICCDFRTYSMIDGVAQQHLALKNCIVWYKGDGGLGSMYQNCHELVWFGVRQERRRVKVNKTGQRTINGQPNVWRYTPPTFISGKDAPLHTANKPLGMFERMVENSSDAGDIVADPFLGSGTTLIACERLGRRCRGIEISPAYVAVTLQRWADLTGKTPELLQGDPPALPHSVQT